MPSPGKLKPIIDECRRQHESCLYSSTSLYELAKALRTVRIISVIVPLACGSLASWGVLKGSPDRDVQLLTAALAFAAGLIPSIMSALKFDQSLDRCMMLANEFKNLQDRFRQAAQITAHKGIAELEKEFNQLRDRMDELRRTGMAIPNWYFNKAKKKIDAGHYKFEVDEELLKQPNTDENLPGRGVP